MESETREVTVIAGWHLLVLTLLVIAPLVIVALIVVIAVGLRRRSWARSEERIAQQTAELLRRQEWRED